MVEQRPRALLTASETATLRLTRIRAQMQCLSERHPAAYLTRNEEIGYLVNTLIAGCAIAELRALRRQMVPAAR